MGYRSKCLSLWSGTGASTKIAINKWVNGIPLKAFHGAENGNGYHWLVQGNQCIVLLALNITEGKREKKVYRAEGRESERVLSRQTPPR